LLLALGDAERAAGRDRAAAAAWRAAADSAGDFTTMEPVPHSPMTYFSVLAARRLGDEERAGRLTAEFAAYVDTERRRRAAIDYFATSLPTMLIFHDDIQQTHDDRVALMDAELAVLDGDPERARALLEELQQRDPADARVRELLRQVQRAPVG
jgi:hypothetical protein